MDEETALFRETNSRRVAPQKSGITPPRQTRSLEATPLLRVLSLPASQQRHLCALRRTVDPPLTLTWTTSLRITSSHYPGKPNHTAGLQAARARLSPTSCWTGRLLGMDLLESDLKEGVQALDSTGADRETPVLPNPIRDHAHLPPLAPLRVILPARTRLTFLSRNFPAVRQLLTALGFHWIRQERWPSMLWLMSIKLSPNPNKIRALLSHHNITLPHRIHRALGFRGGLVRVMAA